GPDGNLWFVEQSGKVGRITPSGAVTEFPIPTYASVPTSITETGGNIWFVEYLGNKVGMITPAGAITEFPIPTSSSGVNDDELADLIEFGKTVSAEVRFIEYMDVGAATHWSMEKVVSRAEMLAALATRYGPIEPIPREGNGATAPAARFRLADGTTFGIISATTEPFCSTCNRGRLTADGTWYPCLHALTALPLP